MARGSPSRSRVVNNPNGRPAGLERPQLPEFATRMAIAARQAPRSPSGSRLRHGTRPCLTRPRALPSSASRRHLRRRRRPCSTLSCNSSTRVMTWLSRRGPTGPGGHIMYPTRLAPRRLRAGRFNAGDEPPRPGAAAYQGVGGRRPQVPRHRRNDCAPALGKVPPMPFSSDLTVPQLRSRCEDGHVVADRIAIQPGQRATSSPLARPAVRPCRWSSTARPSPACGGGAPLGSAAGRRKTVVSGSRSSSTKSRS